MRGMDQDVRDILVEICGVFREKVTWDIVKRNEQETVTFHSDLQKRLDEMIERLKIS